LTPGDLVLLFTDGIIESESATGTEWALAGLKQTVRANLPAAGSALLNCLLANAQDFTGTREFADDVCVAAVELVEERPANAAESHWSDPTAMRCDRAQKSVADRMSLFANFA